MPPDRPPEPPPVDEWRPDDPTDVGEPHMAVDPPPAVRSEPRSLRYHDLAGARPQPAGRVLVIGALALLLAAVLNVDGLTDLANRQPVGWKRDVSRAALAPFCLVGRLTHLRDIRTTIREAADKAVTPCEDPPVSGEDAFRDVATTTVPTGTTAPPVTHREVTADEPLRVWVGGDSMAIELSQSVEDLTTGRGELDVSTHAQVSSGLSRPDFFDWPAHLTDEVLPGAPDVVVVMFGANDSQGLEIDGAAYQPDSDEWKAEYRRRVGVVMDMLQGDGRLVVWVGQPRMRDGGFDARMGDLDAIFEEEAATRPWVHFLDSRPVLSPDGGGFQASDGGSSLRQADGIHLSRAGADRLAEAVLDVVERDGLGGAPSEGSSTTTAPSGGG